MTSLSIESDIECDLQTVVASESAFEAARQSTLKLIETKTCQEAKDPLRQIIFDGRTRKLEQILEHRTVWHGGGPKVLLVEVQRFPCVRNCLCFRCKISFSLC